ncbi:MAG: 5-(carboxyamino)imidazole ribonucleotide synthase [Solirubrobacteraceae bacterium]|nr:5-(carboxyamino)imidazole ribonucleotide synthase [Solirubrobacteraceae bacterium]
MSATATAAPTARVGIVGGGQLARMSHAAATGLGIEVHVLDAPGAPAAAAGARLVAGDAGRLDDLVRLASRVDVVTFDHEHADPAALRALVDRGVAVRPGPAIKRLAQDKLHARSVLGTELGMPVPAFARVDDAGDVAAFAAAHGWPVVLKAITGGYDGRGVRIAATPHEAEGALAALGRPALAEAHVAIDTELSVLVARAAGTGETRAYPVVETLQRDGICHETVLPARVEPDVAACARALGLALAEAIELEGLLAVELFVSGGGLLVNELALRPHNSGHVTLDGCVTSQFEQHLRAVLGWPLGATRAIAPAAAMVNVLGPADGSDPGTRVAQALAVQGAHVHLYGKAPRPGRKLGHVTALGHDADAALHAARAAAHTLEGRR